MINKLNAVATTTKDNTVLTLPVGTILQPMKRYDICITNPIPVNGYNLPIIVLIKGCDTPYALIRNGLGDPIFGVNEKCHKCLITYFNALNNFVDLRIKEYRPYCECE